jgi:hypothetical protein
LREAAKERKVKINIPSSPSLLKHVIMVVVVQIDIIHEVNLQFSYALPCLSRSNNSSSRYDVMPRQENLI